MEQPVIESFGAAHITGSGQKEKGGGGQNGDEYPYDSDCREKGARDN